MNKTEKKTLSEMIKEETKLGKKLAKIKQIKANILRPKKYKGLQVGDIVKVTSNATYKGKKTVLVEKLNLDDDSWGDNEGTNIRLTSLQFEIISIDLEKESPYLCQCVTRTEYIDEYKNQKEYEEYKEDDVHTGLGMTKIITEYFKKTELIKLS